MREETELLCTSHVSEKMKPLPTSACVAKHATASIAPVAPQSGAADCAGILRAAQDGTPLIATENGHGILVGAKDEPLGKGQENKLFRYKFIQRFV